MVKVIIRIHTRFFVFSFWYNHQLHRFFTAPFIFGFFRNLLHQNKEVPFDILSLFPPAILLLENIMFKPKPKLSGKNIHINWVHYKTFLIYLISIYYSKIKTVLFLFNYILKDSVKRKDIQTCFLKFFVICKQFRWKLCSL